jgi:hypothetical protein
LYYYLLGFRLTGAGGTAELASIQEVYRRHLAGASVPDLHDAELAPLISHRIENLFVAEETVDAKHEPIGATRLKLRRWNDGLWYLVRKKGEPDFVTNETYSVTYTCPPTDALDPLWGCWDVNAGLVLFTESKSLPPYELGYLPPKAYLWYYRENRVETYTLDRVAVDKALRQFIRKQK